MFLLALLLGFTEPAQAEIFRKSSLRYWAVTLGESNYPRRCDEDRQAAAILHAQNKAFALCRETHSECALVSNYISFNGQLDRAMREKYGLSDEGLLLYYGCEAVSSLKGL